VKKGWKILALSGPPHCVFEEYLRVKDLKRKNESLRLQSCLIRMNESRDEQA